MPTPPADLELRARVDAVRRDVQRAHELRLAGRYTLARERAAAALASAEQLAYPPLIARAQLALGFAAQKTGDLEPAEAAMILAYTRAGTIGDDDLALSAALRLTYLVGYLAARHAEGLVWSRSVDMLIDRLDQRGTLTESAHLGNLASIELELGHVDRALELFTRSLELDQRLGHGSGSGAELDDRQGAAVAGDLAAADDEGGRLVHGSDPGRSWKAW